MYSSTFSPTPQGVPGSLTPVAASPLPFNDNQVLVSMPVISLPKSPTQQSLESANQSPKEIYIEVPKVSMQTSSQLVNATYNGAPPTQNLDQQVNYLVQQIASMFPTTTNPNPTQVPVLNLPQIQPTTTQVPVLNLPQPTTTQVSVLNLPQFQQTSSQFPVLNLPQFQQTSSQFPVLNLPQFQQPQIQLPSVSNTYIPQLQIPTVNLPQTQGTQSPSVGLPSVQLPNLPSVPSLTYPNLPQVSQIPSVTFPSLPQINPPGYLPGLNLSLYGTLGDFIPTILADNELGDLRWNKPNPPQPIQTTSSYRRVGCIGDGSCFFHAIAKGLSEIYQLSYRRFNEITERTLRSFEAAVANAITFPPNLFGLTSRSQDLDARYTLIDQNAVYGFRALLHTFRLTYVRMLRQDFANQVLNNDRMQAIIANRFFGSIERNIDTIIANEYRRILRMDPNYRYVPQDTLDSIVATYLSGPIDTQIQNLITMSAERGIIITADQIRNTAFQSVKQATAQELLSGNAVQPDFMLLLSDFVGIDIYLLRDADLISPDPNRSPLYSGASLHAAVHGPSDMRPQGDEYEGLPDRRAIVIIAVDDVHYEIVARVDTIQGEGEPRQQIHTNLTQEEPLIRRLYELLVNLRNTQ